MCSFIDVHGWPEGTFGLPMPKTGCPVGAVVDWETGKETAKMMITLPYLFLNCLPLIFYKELLKCFQACAKQCFDIPIDLVCAL